MSIPYIHRNRTSTEFITTIRNVDLVLERFRGITAMNIDTAPDNIQKLFNIEMRRRIDQKTLLELGPKEPCEWRYVHQQLGRELAMVHDRFAFFYDTRTGKTPMSLQIIVDDIERHPDHKWLVLCPLILVELAWLTDAQTFFPDLKVVNLHHTDKNVRLGKYKLDGNLYISNTESFCSYRKHIEQLPIYGCFLDESSSMKSHKSDLGKAAVEYSYRMNKWYLLSGTPAPNGDYEYYRQLQSVDFYGIHQSWTQFKEYFFNNVSRSPQFEKLVKKPEKDFEFTQLLKKYSIYVDKEDVLTTPGRDFLPYEISLPSELRDYYENFKKELYLEITENNESIATIIANGIGSKLNKLNQISSGFVMDTRAIKDNKIRRKAGITDDFEQEVYLLSLYKITALSKLLQNIGDEQCIIWANYHEEFDLIAKHLKEKCGLVYGKIGINEKTKTIKRFLDGQLQYLVASPASIDKGLTFVNAHFCVYFSMNYSYELWKQSTERIYGDISKQKHRCTYYILLANNTVDEVIYETVKTKGDMSKAMLEHLKGSFSRR